MLHSCHSGKPFRGAARICEGRCCESNYMGPRRLFWIWAVFATLTVALPLRAEEVMPSPALSPQQVVKFQLDSLRQNDEPAPNTGIERSFRFASPSNKEVTGPLEHFAELVRSPAYAPLLYSLGADLTQAEVSDDQARIFVRVTSASGSVLSYVFLLSRQKEGEYRDCWMTDGVIRMQDQEGAPKPVTI